MALTRAAIEGRLVLANRRFLELADLPTTTAGDNAAVGAVLEDALKRMGYTVATPGSPSDAEAAVVPARRHPHLYALSNVLLLEFILGNVGAIPTEQANAQRVEWGGVIAELRRRIQDGWEVMVSFANDRSGSFAGGPIATRPYPPDAILEPWVDVS